jgi:hypothetical protein
MFTKHSLGACHRSGKALWEIRFNDNCVTATDDTTDAIDTLQRLNDCDYPIIGNFINGTDKLNLHIYTYDPMVYPFYYFSDLSVGFHLNRNVDKDTLLRKAIAVYKRKNKVTLLGCVLWLTWQQTTDINHKTE